MQLLVPNLFIMPFPFSNMSDSELLELLNPSTEVNEKSFLEIVKDKIFEQFSFSVNETDTDSFYQNNLNINNPVCEYYLPDSLKNVLLTECNSEFKVVFHNINSLPKKLDIFSEECVDLIGENTDILGFCETKFSDEVTQLYKLPNYSLYTNNVSRDMGGVAIYVLKHHNAHLRSDLSIMKNHIESLFIEISKPQQNILVGVIYRRPHTTYYCM